MNKAWSVWVIGAGLLMLPVAALAQSPSQALGTAAPAGYAQDAKRTLLTAVKTVVAENPSLADSRGEEALLQAVSRVARQQPQMAGSVAQVAKGLKPHLASRIDDAARMPSGQIAPPAVPAAVLAPKAASTQSAKGAAPLAAPVPAASGDARQVLMRNVRAVVAEDPSLKDSVGDRALIRAVERSVAQQPQMADAIVAQASAIKPHLSDRILLASAEATQFDGAYANMYAAPAPEWADAPLPNVRQGRAVAQGEQVPEWALAGLPGAGVLPASARGGANNDIFAMGLEDLMNTKVVTASRSQERAFDVPAAITVITNEDIRRSGQTTVMEVLRMVPGVQVSRIHSGAWAISTRGFADEYANKMLVLIDGRSIYNSTFSGVYWDMVNLPLEDIDRIEVIRGPGATMWGANAVNGVINIVTKESKYTQGAYVSGGVGTHERSFAEGRVGGQLGNYGHYRMYSRYLDRERTDSPSGGDQHNAWSRLLTGFRADWSNQASDNFTVQGELQKGNNEQHSVSTGPSANESDSTLAYLRGRWSRVLQNGGLLTFNGFVDQHVRNTDVLDQRLTTLDMEMNHSFNWQEKHGIVWGLGYRLLDDNYNSTPVFSFADSDTQRSLYSAFIQNTYAATENLDLTLGTKLEHTDFTGLELQPTAKFSYRPDSRSTVWGSVARATRSPSRMEDAMRYIVQEIPGAPPIRVVGFGNTDLESEDMIAYELGYRLSPREGLVFDASAYYNDYSDMAVQQQGTPYFDGGFLIQPITLFNLGEAEMYGVELSASWQVNPKWLLAGNYSYSDLKTDVGAGDAFFIDYQSLWRKHSFSLRSLYNITEDWEFDTSLYYMSSLNRAREVDNVTLTPLDAQLKWDLRLGWRPLDGLELSLVGLDLLNSGKQEFVNARFYPASEIGRSVYGKATWHF